MPCRIVTTKTSVNPTSRAEAGELDPMIGCEREIKCVVHILARKTKNDGRVTGLHASRPKPVTPVQLQTAVFDNTLPPINTRVTVHEFLETLGNLEQEPGPTLRFVHQVLDDAGRSDVARLVADLVGRP